MAGINKCCEKEPRKTMMHFYSPDSEEGCGKVAISFFMGCPRKHFRANRFRDHCRKVYIGKLLMNYLADKVCTTSSRKHFRANRFGNHSRKNCRKEAFYKPPVPSCVAPSESQSSTLPRITFHQVQVRIKDGSSAQMPCVAQGSPPPNYRWMKEGSNGVLRAVKEDGRIWISQGILNIKIVNRVDDGKYQCIARNSIGERRIESSLIVTAPLAVHLLPPYQVLNIGQEAVLNCNFTGYPVHSVVWKKNQRQLPSSSRLRFLSRDVLHISSISREDRGMYQCFVYNDLEEAQGTAELKITCKDTFLLPKIFNNKYGA
ncbi:hypothetical protein AVEN_252790-1 [Araneus ventricosus]|uniref:Ig-like domain-containing protein n=1 Tax=Araneus ventricosus TaxID=182803 RepID=A0A4Y2CKG0_ARAVE|nr:hypothetical protein AVEN_252790-1 [Araneus ventricosus]